MGARRAIPSPPAPPQPPGGAPPSRSTVPAVDRVLLSAVLEVGTQKTGELLTSRPPGCAGVHLQTSSSGQYKLRRRSSAALCTVPVRKHLGGGAGTHTGTRDTRITQTNLTTKPTDQSTRTTSPRGHDPGPRPRCQPRGLLRRGRPLYRYCTFL